MDISGHTRLVGLIGTPVAHSISPAIQNAGFKILGLDFAYLAFDVKEEGLEKAVRGLVAIGAAGFNITMPHKTAVMDFLDEISPAARLAGACNTVVIGEDGKLFGDNTDGTGFMRAAREAGFRPDGGRFTILGAGGAARAIISRAAIDGVSEIYIMRRRREPAWTETTAFADKVSAGTGCTVKVFPIDDEDILEECVWKSTMLVNATSAGMSGKDAHPISDEAVLRPGLIVGDVVYHPARTQLLLAAKEHGCIAFNGLGMLLYQGAAAFYEWTGHEMPVDLVRKEIHLG